MSNLKYSQILDYILGTLSGIKQLNSDAFLSLPAVLNVLDYQASFSETTEIADYLETKGYVKVIYTIGDVLVQITSMGMLHIEALDEQTADAPYSNFLEKLMSEKKLDLQTFNPDSNPKGKVVALIDKVKGAIINQEGKDNDYAKDLDIIKIELLKKNPDYRIIEIKINDLYSFNYVVTELSELRNYIAHAV